MKLKKSTKVQDSIRQDTLQLLKGAVAAKDIDLVRKLLKHKRVINNSRKLDEILWIAFEDHQAEIAMMLIHAGANVKKYNVNDSSFSTVLHGAIKVGCDELTKLVIERGADVNARDIYGDSVLHQAMYCNASPEMVRQLLEHGADIEARNHNCQDVLQAAAKSNRASEVVMLLVNWGNPGLATRRSRAMAVLWELVCAPEDPNLCLLHDLLSTGVPVTQDSGEWELTLFERAIIERKYMMVVLMLDLAEDIRGQVHKLDAQPLFLAAGHDDSSIAKLLLKNGTNIDARNQFGQTPLFAACHSGSYQNINLLLQLGADINKVDDKGHVALSFLDHTFHNLMGRMFIIKHIALLISQEAQVNSENLTIIQSRLVTKIYFDACVRELQSMKDVVIYNEFTLHSILSMKIDRLTLVMRNHEFVENLKKRLNSRSYPLYYDLADKKLNIAERRLALIDNEIECLVDIFKDMLPILVIEKIVCYSCREDLFTFIVNAF